MTFAEAIIKVVFVKERENKKTGKKEERQKGRKKARNRERKKET